MRCFFVLLRQKILDYAARFLKKCDEICGIFMPFYAMKLRELAKVAEKCGNLRKMQLFNDDHVA
jgi:hypothetical protein